MQGTFRTRCRRRWEWLGMRWTMPLTSWWPVLPSATPAAPTATHPLRNGDPPPSGFLSSFGFYEPHRSRAFLPRGFCQWIGPQVLSASENQHRTGEVFATLVPAQLRTRERERVFWFVYTFSVVRLSSCVILEARHCYSKSKVRLDLFALRQKDLWFEYFFKFEILLRVCD